MAKLLIGLVPIVFLTIVLAFYRLPSGWFVPSFQEVVTQSVGPVKLELPEIHLRWGGWRHPLGFRVRDITLNKETLGLKLVIPEFLFSLKILPLLTGKAEIGQCYFNSAKLYENQNLIGILSSQVKKRKSKIYLKADFKQVNATALFYLMLGKNVDHTENLPLEGKLLLEGNLAHGLTTLNLECKSQGGYLVLPGPYPDPVKLDQLHLQMKGTGQTITLQKFEIKRGDARLAIEGSIHSPVSWNRMFAEGGKLSLALQGNGAAIPVDDLKLLWPQGLSLKPRHWVVNHLSKGNADQVTTTLEGIIEVEPGAHIKNVAIPRIDGLILASGVTVDYFGKLPPVLGAKGQCRFTREKFIIDAVGVANNVNLKSAHIIINDLHLKDQTIDLDLDLEGPVNNSLEIINAEPLYLAKKLDVEPKRMSGQSQTKVHIAFPLETNVTLDLVDVLAQSQLSDAKIIYDAKLNGKPVCVDKGSFALEVTKKSLSMKGKANLQDVGINLEWQEHFGDKKIPFRRQFKVQSNVDLKKMKNFGIDADDYLRGQAPTTVTYTVDSQGEGVVEGFMDLTSSVMVSPVLFWQKDEGEKAHLKVILERASSQDRFVLEQATLFAPKLSITMTQKKGPSIDDYVIDSFKMGDSHVSGTLRFDQTGAVAATLQGKTLDLTHILDDTIPDPLIRPKDTEDSDSGSDMKVKVYLDEVRLGKNNVIHSVSGDILYRKGTMVQAKLFGKAPHNDEKISLDMNPLAGDRQQFTLKSGDGGHLLEMLGAGYDLEGGQLVIEGTKTKKRSSGQNVSAKQVWEITGKMSIEDFTINRAPLLAKLLAAASVQGIVNFFSGKGIHFYTGEADFAINEATLSLKNVRLISPALGLLLAGAIDRVHHKVNFKGDLIPLYAVNTVLAHMPVLGRLFSGGREDGIFMTQFSLTGDRKDPDLAINPISTVTPGVVRELFTPAEEIPTHD